ncbi:MAG: PTS sugar transporter subunit IIA [Deltaproteobacteria bacterium]|jgi:PTS system mannose-specific IIA component|nr:PTS sugar transporter subunit IIA [Deltaproteobacteria bacterium]MDA8308179.1 PTS sugar transporter subunit IIA [Deltaproteobacteria bacterium]
MERGTIGIVAASHCRLAEEMIIAAEMIVGPLRNCKAVCFKPDKGPDELMKLMEDAIKEVDQGKGVLVLTDLFGGTPANISLSFRGPKVEIICGMNLPMLIKLAGCRNGLSLNETASLVKEYGQRHISLASEVLSRPAKMAPLS